MEPRPGTAELTRWIADEAAALARRSADARAAAIERDLDSLREALDRVTGAITGGRTTPIDAADVGAFVDRTMDRVGLEALRAQLEDYRAQAEAHRATIEQRDAAIQQLTRQHEETRGELEAALQQARDARARATAAQAEAAEMRTAFDASLDDLQREHAMVLGEHARSYTSLPLDQLLTVFHELGKAQTITDVLAALVNGIAREFSRVALFRVHGARLECTQQTGFFQTDIAKLGIPLRGDSLLTRCVKTGQMEWFLGAPRSDSRTLIPFGGGPSCALAMPIVVRGTVAALAYADDSNDAEEAEGAQQARAKFGELVYRHAMLVLSGVSSRAPHQPSGPWGAPVEWAAHPSVDEVPQVLRDLALRLADDLEHEYKANAEIGRNHARCRDRLREQLQQSRRLYAERILTSDHPLEGSMAANFLDQHLIATARAHSDTSFGRDLAALVAAS